MKSINIKSNISGKVRQFVLSFLIWGMLSNLHVDAGFQLPIVVAAGDTPNIAFKDITVDLKPGEAGSARFLRLVVHNLQKIPSGNPMAYLRINNSQGYSNWIHLSNDNPAVVVSNKDKAYGGIGGGFHTLMLRIDLQSLQNGNNGNLMTLDETNTFRFYINPQAYAEGSSAYRVIWMRVTNSANWESLLENVTYYNPGNASDAGEYIAANTQTTKDEGKFIWENEALIARPGEDYIRAKCADCHTKTGYDLKYFGYSNESIFKRAKFHGLDDDKAKKVTRYIRSLPVFAYGRPWNPPYQPGKVKVSGEWEELSKQPVARWAAGAGVWQVLGRDEDMIPYVFGRDGEGKVALSGVESAFRLSQTDLTAPYLGLKLADIPIHLQLPDWNRWLPRVHPVDIWADFKNEDIVGPDPYKAYANLARDINGGITPLNDNLSALHGAVWSFLRKDAAKVYLVKSQGEVQTGSIRNIFREASEGHNGRLKIGADGKFTSNVSAPYQDDMFDEYAKRALTHWEGVKYFEIFHEGGLEDKMGIILSDSKISDEDRGWGLRTATVFNNAPHKTASNTMYWEGRTNSYNGGNPAELDSDDQRPVEGLYASVVWYHLEALLNPGNKQPVSVSNAVDWSYNYQLLYRLADYSGQPQAMLYATTLMKNWQVRDIKRPKNLADGTKFGWGLRTCTPFLAYSYRIGISDVMAELDNYSTDLYKNFLSTAVKRWMEVVTHPDFPYRFHPTNENLNELDDWPRLVDENRPWSILPKEDYVPSEWNGRRYLFNARNSADTFWRLLPLLDQVGVDKDVLNNFSEWCQAAWPGPDGNKNNWSGRLRQFEWATTHVVNDRPYRFESMMYPGKYIKAMGGTGSHVRNLSVADGDYRDLRSTWKARAAAGQWLYLNQVLSSENSRLYSAGGGALSLASSELNTGSDVMWRALSMGDGKVRLQGKPGKIKFINAINAGGILWHAAYGFYPTEYPANQSLWKLVYPW